MRACSYPKSRSTFGGHALVKRKRPLAPARGLELYVSAVFPVASSAGPYKPMALCYSAATAEGFVWSLNWALSVDSVIAVVVVLPPETAADSASQYPVP